MYMYTFVFFSLAFLPAGLQSVCRMLKLDFCYFIGGVIQTMTIIVDDGC